MLLYHMIIAGVDVKISKKKIRSINIYVRPEGVVTVTAPLSMYDEDIEKFLLSKEDWISKKILLIKERSPASEYKDGDAFHVLGVKYIIKTAYGSSNSLVLSDDHAYLTIKKGNTNEQTEMFIREWYRQILKKETERLLPKWERITGQRALEWQTKFMRTKWGTCNITTKKIWLNVQLASRPVEQLECVILHELVHLIEKKHNERFKMLMDIYMPEWREITATMNNKK